MTFITTNDLRSSRGSYSMGRRAIQAFLRKLNGVITEEQYREREGILLGSFSYRPCSTRNSGARFQRRWRRGIRVSVARSVELARQLVQYQSRGTHAQFLLGLLELSDLLGRPAVPGSARMREIDSATPPHKPSTATQYRRGALRARTSLGRLLRYHCVKPRPGRLVGLDLAYALSIGDLFAMLKGD